MAYTINKYSGVQLVVLEDGTVDTSTSIGLVGRNYVGYGEIQNENFLYLLENFANINPPARPLEGQLWFNTTNDLLHVYDGAKWVIVGSAVISETAPVDPPNGALWYKMPYRTLHVYEGGEWKFIGPETAEGFATTRARSTVLFDSDGNRKPVILIEVNGNIIGIITSQAFTLAPATAPAGFGTLAAGINLIFGIDLKGNVQGKATRADRLETARNINGTPFDGTTDVNIRANTTNSLVRGAYLTGANFDGSTQTTWAVDASSSNLIGKVVVRDSSGNFSAGTVTANLIGNVQGNVTAASGTSIFDTVTANRFIGATLTGNAATASRLETARLINGVSFDGGSNVTVPAAGETLTGVSLATNIKSSYLEQVGTLSTLNVSNPGITIGSQLKVFMGDSGTQPTIRSLSGSLNFDCGSSGPDITLLDATSALSNGFPNQPALVAGGSRTVNIGTPLPSWGGFDKVYANEFKGNADTATLATRSTNIVGGAAGSIPYQTAANTTTLLPLGPSGSYLRASASGLTWSTLGFEGLVPGAYLVGSNYNTSSQTTWSVDATSANTANKVVARDASGNFYAGTISANLVGQVTGNASTATRLQTPRAINGVSFDGSSDITINANDPSKVPSSGGSMSGYLTLVGNPVNGLHAATKQYVDTFAQQYTFTYGNTIYSQAGFTNQVGSWNNGANYFDVFPPSGKSMSNLIAFIPSIAVIHYAGGVDGNDSLRCTWSNLGDRIRVYVQNTEQRSTPAANYLAIWS